MKSVLVAFTFAAVLVTYEAAKLPSDVPRCKFEDVHCFENAVEQAVRIMKDGNQKINLIPIDPLHVTTINIDTGAGNFRLKLNMSECDISGLSNLNIDKIVSKSDKVLHWQLTGSIPKVEMTSDYVADGQVLILPIQGNGKAKFVLHDVGIQCTVREQDHKFEKKGKKHIKLNQYEVKLAPKLVTYRLENLFNGDKTLGDNLNNFMNDNWEDIFKEVQPALEDSLSAIFLELTNRVFDKVNVDNVYL